MSADELRRSSTFCTLAIGLRLPEEVERRDELAEKGTKKKRRQKDVSGLDERRDHQRDLQV